jgi:glycosyltransferase involved in cell wall biosynthesis
MKISVITVTLNAERFLRQTILSVLGQDYNNYEYIIIDGRSHDQTLAIIEEYAALDARIQYKSEPDRGISDAMNKGAQLANGDILVCLHADDFFADTSVLKRVAKLLENPSEIWLTGGIRYVDQAGSSLMDITARRFSYRRLLRGNIILHPATFVKRNTFMEVGGFSTVLHYAMDYDLWLRIGEIAPPLVIRDILTCFRVHGGSLSCKDSDKAFAEEWNVRKLALGGHKTSYLFHYGYYMLKKLIHGRYLKRNL